MTTLAAIRTHQWGEDQERVLASLRPVFGDDIVVVFHNRPEGVLPPVEVVDINDDWLAENGLRHLDDWGWRCGDYFYYALRQARPAYDYYWLIEPDVYFGGPAKGFFRPFEAVTVDALGYKLAAEQDSRFIRSLKGVDPHRAIFALTRFSGRALDMLFRRRQEFGAQKIRPRIYANDEAFCFSYVQADPGMTSGRLEDIVPDWFDGAQFSTNPDMLVDVLAADPEASGKVFHPALSRIKFKRELSKRIAHGRSRVLKKMSASLQELSDDDVREIAEETGKALSRYLNAQRAQK